MAVKSAKIYDAGSLQKERKVLGKFEGFPGIIQCYGDDITVDEDREKVYNLLLEFAHEGTLGDLIEKTGGCGLPEPDVRFYTRCILEGLSKIHESGYVHCDIKPDNILMVVDGLFDPTYNHVAKISDFGMVKKADKKASTRGSPMYVSPEVVKFRIQEPPSDIWALGCVVLKMLTGMPPWVLNIDPKDENSVMMELLSMICSTDESPAIASNISEEGKDFLRCCLTKNPARRSTASELLNHKFVMAFKEKGQEKGNEGEGVLNAEGVSSPSSTAYKEGSSVFLEGSSGSSI